MCKKSITTKLVSVASPEILEEEIQKFCDKYIECDIEIEYRPIIYNSNKFIYSALLIARWNEIEKK